MHPYKTKTFLFKLDTCQNHNCSLDYNKPFSIILNAWFLNKFLKDINA